MPFPPAIRPHTENGLPSIAFASSRMPSDNTLRMRVDDMRSPLYVAQSATFTLKPYLRNSSGVPAPFSPNRQLAPQCIRSISGKRPLRYSANPAGDKDANSRVNGTACTFLSEPFRTPIAFRQRTRSSRSMSSGGTCAGERTVAGWFSNVNTESAPSRIR